MKKLMMIIALSALFFLSCDYGSSEKTFPKAETRSAQNENEDSQQDERERIELANKILKNLREPNIIETKRGSSLDEKSSGPYPEAGLSSSLGLGSIDGSGAYEIEIQHTDEEILKCSKDIAEHLPEIYKNSKYSQVQKEIIRILKMVNLDDKEESIVSAVHELFRKLKTKLVLEALEEKYKTEYWGTRQLNLLYTISEINPSKKADLIAYINEIFRLLFSDRLSLRFNALKIIRQIKPSSTLDLMLECFKNEKYKNREDFIFGLSAFYEDRRVKQLFKQILQSDFYSIRCRMAVVRFFNDTRDGSVNALILKITDQEMAKKYERDDENYSNSTECLGALAHNGDETTIKELQKLKLKHKNHEAGIDNAIEKIKKLISR